MQGFLVEVDWFVLPLPIEFISKVKFEVGPGPVAPPWFVAWIE